MPIVRRIVLASASPRRRELLASLGLEVTVRPTGIPEDLENGVSPAEAALFHARAKADAAVARSEDRSEDLIVAADTVVDVDGSALGKPVDAAQAIAMLEGLAGREHLVHSAFVLVDAAGPRIARPRVARLRVERLATTVVRFFPLGRPEIEAYVATGEPFDKAGAYGIQGLGATLVERIDGDFYTVMGFPLALFAKALPELGYELPYRALERV